MDGGPGTSRLTPPASDSSTEIVVAADAPVPARLHVQAGLSDNASVRVIARRRRIALVVAGLWSFDLARPFGVGGSLDWVRRHPVTGLGEVVVALLVGALGLAMIAWRHQLRVALEPSRLDHTRHPLALATERHWSLVELHPDAVFSLDLAGRFTATNPSCPRVTGHSPDRLHEMTLFDLLAPGYAEDAAAALRQALAGEPHRFETAVVHPDGHLVELTVTALPIVAGDAVVGVRGIAEDITGEQSERRELVRPRVQPVQADEAETPFLANGQSVPFDVRLLVDEVTAEVRPVAERKRLFFKSTVAPGVPERVLGDPTKLAQALTNLLDNALTLTDSGWVRLVVSSAHHFGDHVGVRFEVHDSGIDAAQDQRRRQSLALRQSEPSTQRRDDESGLGLTISHELVTDLGGAIALCSVPGLGSVLNFTLSFALPVSVAS